MTLDYQALLHPVSDDHPVGEDVSFDDVYDQIREARRADDTQLDQGDWQIERKVADWRLAAGLAETVLRDRSKDLQVAAWLAEAWIHRHGLPGAAAAFSLLQGLLDQYWQPLYPQMDGDDAEERASKLAWLNNYGSAALRLLPLAPGQPGTSLNDWQSSRDMDNLARQNRDAYEAALADGKPTGEAFDAALAAGGGAALRTQMEAVAAAQTAFEALQASTDRLFGRDAPSLANLADTLKRQSQVLARAGQDLGVAPATGGQPTAETADTAATSIGTGNAAIATPGVSLTVQASQQTSKADALKALGDIAAFFKRTEPHSPVASLLERAVAWADMPLEQWLQEVVRDDSVLAGIRDRIGMPRRDDD